MTYLSETTAKYEVRLRRIVYGVVLWRIAKLQELHNHTFNTILSVLGTKSCMNFAIITA